MDTTQPLQVKNNDFSLVEAGMHAQTYFAEHPEADAVQFELKFAPVEGRPELDDASDLVTVHRDGRIEA